MKMAAECWQVELRARTPHGWRRATLTSLKALREFVAAAPGTSDVIIFSVEDGHVARLIPAGDDFESERMLAALRRALLTCTSDDFARECGLVVSGVYAVGASIR